MTSVQRGEAFGCATEIGHVREHNEDSYLADPDLGLFVVADGMGGHEAGEVASHLACHAIQSSLQKGQDLKTAIHDAQYAIDRAVDSGTGSPGMGTTVVVLQLIDKRYQLAWVGDSRAYLWHDGQLRQLSQDHSYVQELVDNQAISPEEAEHHPEKSTLSRCLGGGIDDQLNVDELTGVLYQGERIILCTDGVSGELSDDQIARCMRTHSERTPAEIARALVDAALDAGGSDNATVLVVAAPGTATDRMRRTAPRKSIQARPSDDRRPCISLKWALLLVSGAALIALLAGMWLVLTDSDAEDTRAIPDEQSSLTQTANHEPAGGRNPLSSEIKNMGKYT